MKLEFSKGFAKNAPDLCENLLHNFVFEDDEYACILYPQVCVALKLLYRIGKRRLARQYKTAYFKMLNEAIANTDGNERSEFVKTRNYVDRFWRELTADPKKKSSKAA